MRSNEIASLAGVTVRALRHYHAIGLLPEPPRQDNGYREYGSEHLARVFRIKQLASLGFPLDRIGAMLDQLDAASDQASAATSPLDELDELDSAIQAEIERLEAQRRTIAQIKREHLDPDLPVRFARAIKVLCGSEGLEIAPPEEQRTLLLLVGHLYRECDLDELERLTASMEHLGLVQHSIELDRMLNNLPETASEAERAALASKSVELFVPLLDLFDIENWDRPYTAEEALLLEFQNSLLNEAQKDVFERIYRELEERIVKHAMDDASHEPSTISRASLDPDATS